MPKTHRFEWRETCLLAIFWEALVTTFFTIVFSDSLRMRIWGHFISTCDIRQIKIFAENFLNL